MLRIPGKTCSFLTSVALAILLSATAVAQSNSDSILIQQSRGADQSVKYEELAKYGPWDDRNYALTAHDLKYLAKNEDELHDQVPAFFRVEMRKMWPHLRNSGPAQYPRAALQMFGLKYGGLMQNGKIEFDRRELAKKPDQAGREIQLNQVLGANEITVEINPVNPQQVIAGANNNGGQEMYYSTDGGVTWTIQGVLPNTCCDPTVDWSSDGSIAYAAALSGPIGVSAWRSFDGGQTWVDRRDLTTSGSDKEFIHVDRSPSSPYQDNVYVTYHNGNTMQFARSEDMGDTYDIQSFPGAPSGIGSDITTTSNGDIYYAYGAFGTQTIQMLKSTDGGLTFDPSFSIANTNGSFDFPIPAMESRNAWIYATTDSDRSGGPFDGSVYVSWTDTNAPESGVAANNHTQVHVAYSRDGGTTWNSTIVHPTADVLTVDRFNQWMKVDEFGNVHVVFYDTRNSVNRTGVDLYYTFSSDGGVNWTDPERVSSATSANLTDGQEWGDYNGLSVLGDKVISAWTDNRDGPPNMKDVYVDDEPNAGAAAGFSLSADPLTQLACAFDTLDDIAVSVGSVQGFVNPVTLSFSTLPAGFSGGFSTNPVTPAQPPNTSIASVTLGAVAAGGYSFDIMGSATGAADKSTTINVTAFDAAPGAAGLVAPLDGALNVSTAPTLSWTAVPGASTYTVEIDDDPAFGSIDFTIQTTDTSAAPDGTLSSETTYYWRVRAENPCGEGSNSATFSFTTSLEICRAPNLSIPDATPSGTSDTLVVADSGELADLNVSLKVTHTWVGDLSFSLVHEDTGTSVVLIDRPGVPASTFGCSSDDIDATLDDEGTAPVETTCSSNPALGGNLVPNEPLAAFDGEDLSGSWRLDVADAVGPDPGTLDEWCLVPTLVLPPLDSDGDGVPDADDLCPNTPVGEAVDANGCSQSQLDDDGDGVVNSDDACPNTPVGEAVDANGCSQSQLDDDGDGVANDVDACPNTPAGEAVDANGCSQSQLDDDGDGVVNSDDQCPNTPPGEPVDANGCSAGQVDGDGDGVLNEDDLCPNTPPGEPVDANGCSQSQLDDDGDGVVNSDDACPNTPVGEAVDANGCSQSQLDDDGDGVANDVDACPNTPAGEAVDANGCSQSQLDDDGDGVANDVDACPNTPAGEAVDANGCSQSQLDDDGDGVANDVDACPNTPAGEAVDANGCSQSQLDDDGDGVANDVDACPNTPAGEAVDANGCSQSQLDDDGDGVANDVDACPNTPVGEAVDANGCSQSQLDDDGDGVANDVDACPNTPVGEAVDANGCSQSQLDDDGDGVANDVDACPNTPAGEAVDANGCSQSQLDDDGDGVANDVDACPNTPVGEAVDANGCSQSQLDDDGDGVANDVDACPNTPAGEAVDANGCSQSQLDDDGDGVANDVDACPNTPAGEAVDANGCSQSQLDDDGDGVVNSDDQCPNTPPGEPVDANGCSAGQVDGDGDGVLNEDDLCPNTPPGEPVDANGCSQSQLDDDGDGVVNSDDACPNTPVGEAVDANGCSQSQLDDDGDGVANDVDACPNTPAGEAVDANGCSQSQLDDDGDGVANDVDACPNTPAGEAVDANGCSQSQLDDDGDGVANDVDACPNTPAGEAVDANGCSQSQLDDDGDGVANDVDACPNTPAGEAVDANGCSQSQLDDDGDGVANDVDACPNTPVGEAVDANGCSQSQLDDDGDGVANDVDACPNTPAGEAVDANGCSQSQLDDDGDGVANDVDACPNTPVGEAVDANGCSQSQLDEDGDGVADAFDICPNTPPGEPVDANGCSASQLDDDGDGVPNVADNCTNIPNPDQRDTNGDGYGNICDADLNNDGIVNAVDLGLLRAVFFTADPDADFNGDGVVNPVDLGIMRSLFFQPPGPSGIAP